MSYEDNLKKHNIKLPEAKSPVGNYVATKISGKILFISSIIFLLYNDKRGDDVRLPLC